MTNADVFAQILSEVTGRPKSEITDMLDTALKAFGGGRFKMDEELPDDKAEELLNNLRKEKAGILAWLVKGGLIANPGNIQGSA